MSVPKVTCLQCNNIVPEPLSSLVPVEYQVKFPHSTQILTVSKQGHICNDCLDKLIPVQTH